MALLLIPFIVLVVIVQGVRVILGRYPSSDLVRDEASVRRWEEVRRKGYLMHCVRSLGPYVIGYCVLAPLLKASWQAGRLAYPLHEVSFYCALAVAVALIGGFFNWKILEVSASEARQRLQASGP